MKVKSQFRPAWWLRNPHAQTMYASLCRYLPLPKVRDERLELPDGDFIDLVWRDEGLSLENPLVILLHGLGGGLSSPYIRAQFIQHHALGRRVVLLQFRGSSKELNRALRSYHMGDTADLDYFLQVLADREPHTQKYIVGFSLGGSVLLKWLGEHPLQAYVAAAVAVSVPFHPPITADRLNSGFSRIYQAYLLKKLREHFFAKLAREPNAVLSHSLQSAHSFWTFDDLITAPLNGFKDVHDYHQQVGSRPYLIKITTPTLILHALDDPFMTPDAMPTPEELSPTVRLEWSEQGGHVGFISGAIPGRPTYWLEERIAEFLRKIV
ncbi:MAG: hydrolase [Legionella sp.]|nr:MAG: hydrolase [Legionella sp.]